MKLFISKIVIVMIAEYRSWFRKNSQGESSVKGHSFYAAAVVGCFGIIQASTKTRTNASKSANRSINAK